MAEMVLRKHHRRVDRWMPKKRLLSHTQVTAVLVFAWRAIPGYLLTFADLTGIPSGLSVAYVAALSAASRDARPAALGGAAAVLVRFLTGLAPRWELLPALAVLLILAPRLLPGRKNPWLMAATAISLIPTAAIGTLAPTAAQMVQGWGSLAIGTLSAPVFARGLSALESKRSIASLEERLSVGFLAVLVLCGAARMTLLGVNLGVAGAAFGTLAVSMWLGCGAGALVGMLSGLMLSLLGLPLAVSIALSMGGFLAGVVHRADRPLWTGASFAAGAFLPLLLCRATAVGMGAGVLFAALLMMILPRAAQSALQAFVRRFLPDESAPGDAYAAAALTAWEQTIAAMARAVPSPRDALVPRNADWWEARLCEGCPERESCGAMTTGLALDKAESVWACRTAPEDVWQGALENLRGMGCGRLYHLLDAMNALRREDESERRTIRQAEAQRDMLVTHLTAMSGAARRFAVRSGGGTWWDDATAKRIRRLLDENAAPMRLSFVRRVQGHAVAAFELHHITGARRQAEELCAMLAGVLQSPMQVASIDGDRVLLAERPLYAADISIAGAPITGGADCGDTAWTGVLQDGRQLIVLSDGMGHGGQAALISQQTVELLRLCLDAGYTHQQALTAVNGMLLMGGVGERFATADVLTIDLWTAQTTLDKLGAAPSYLLDDEGLTRLTGDALPLGILDTVDSRTIALRLKPSDLIILLTDGVEDAFGAASALEDAILAALDADDPASALLQAAADADEGQRRDDQSAVFIRLTSARE